MPAVTAQGATFTFLGFGGLVTGISVTTPTAEIADMTSMGSAPGTMVLMPTGDWSGGDMTIECMGTGDPQSLVRQRGFAAFSAPGVRVGRNAICESATIEARTGDVVRYTLRLRLTDA